MHLQVIWQPIFMLMSHVEEYRKIQYTPDGMAKVTQFGPRAAKWLKLMSWKASWEPRESLCQHANLAMDILAIEAGEPEQAARRPWPNSCDLTLSNIERQSFFDPEECRPDDLLATDPHLGQSISINTGQTVNPDLDICPTGTFTIAPVRSCIDPETRQPSQFAVQGQMLNTITQGRLTLLHAQLCANHGLDTTQSRHESAAALAKLFHRYKEGRTSEKYTVNM